METPRSLRQRPTRNPTPRLSERKKSLFAATRSNTIDINSDSEQENYDLDGIAPLNGKKSKEKGTKTRSVEVLLARTPSKPISFLKSGSTSSSERMDDDVFEKLPDSPPNKEDTITSTPRRSRRLSLKPKNTSPPGEESAPARQGKENQTPPQKTCDELPALFTNSMNLNKGKRASEGEVIEESSDEEERFSKPGKKRNYPHHKSETSSEAKIRRTDTSERLSIPTKCFYSHTKTSPQLRSPPSAIVVKRSPKHKRYKNEGMASLINKGVHHKIRRKPKQKISSAVRSSPANVMDILGTIRNEKLRNLLTAKRLEKDQIENVHRIFKAAKNPIEMAKPLSAISRSSNDGNNNSNSNPVPSTRCYMNGAGSTTNDTSLGFSDIECSSESEAELPEETMKTAQQADITADDSDNRPYTPVAGRKFFKSGHSTTKKEVKITDNIRASVCNGRLSLMQDPKQKKKRIRLRNTQVNEFSSEQAKVDEILKNFDISVIAEEEVPTTAVESVNEIATSCPTPTFSNCDEYDNLEEMRMTETEDDDQYDQYDQFRRRLPYNTSDPEIIEQQHLLLDFLITNKICTEQNFEIFIGDPENHKDEAQRIVDQLVVVISENPDLYRQRLPYNTTDPVEMEQQRNFLEFLIENNLCNEENFQIFIADYANRHEEADRIITEVVASTHNISAEDLERELSRFNNKEEITTSDDVQIPDQNKQNQKVLQENSEKLFPIFYPGRCQPMVLPKSTRKYSKTWTGGHGLDQYQIDAGQKQFGWRQCKQCGLVYTVHEPEEEKLHKEFHASLYILKFKSWIDEDIVHIYPEWGNDGRILRITDSSHLKRQERLKDVLQLVDKELGFSSYIMPKTFVAYFAVRQSQIVGLCLVQPLSKAYRYICLNGVDCCTEESFEAKCGISRIWVSPLHRRFRIASKLIRAVQLYTIFGEEIPLEKIAFSAPTEDGKKFAKSVTKMDNFLVYQ